MEKRYVVVNKEKKGNRNIYGVLDREKGRTAYLTTQELGVLCEKGLVRGYGGNSKRVYELAPEKPNMQKPLKGLFTERDRLNYKVMQHYIKYVKGVSIDKELIERVEKGIRHNEEVRPEGEYRHATMTSPRETPTVDVDTLDDVERVAIKIHISEAEAYADLRAKGYLVTKEDIAGINEGRKNDLYNFWFDIIDNYTINGNKEVYAIIDMLYGEEEEGTIKSVEFDIVKEKEGVFSYQTEKLEIDEEKVIERAFDKIGF